MTNEPIDLAAVLAKITESSRGSEMAVRLQQSLAMTDGLWELVPVVVAAAEAHGQRPPAEVADSLPVARALAPERRARLRELGDILDEITATAVQEQPIDETAIEDLTAAYWQRRVFNCRVFSRLGGVWFGQKVVLVCAASGNNPGPPRS